MLLLTVFALFLCSTLSQQSQLPCKPRTGGTPVPIGVFLSSLPFKHLNTEETPEKVDLVPAIKTALNYIQNHSCILSGFKLELIYKDTEVNEPIAMALKYWKIVQLSYAETHAKFADSHEMYPTFFRIVPGDRNLNNAKCRLLRHFGWRKVGTIKQSDEPRHALPHESLTAKLENTFGIKVEYTAGLTYHELENIGAELDELKNRDVRIVVMDVAEDMAAMVLCAAFHRGMHSPNFVWILPGYHSNTWMLRPNLNCSRVEMEFMLRDHFALEFALSRKDQDVTIVGGKKSAAIWQELSERSFNIWQGYLYDGLWTLAIALSQALGKDASFSHTKLLSAINNSSFEGVTGKVRFENNERLGLVDVLQWQMGKYVEVGHFDGATDEFSMDEAALGAWKVPADSTTLELRREYIAYPLFIAMGLLALVGISLALIFLFINLKYRNHRFIKMSSPQMNNVIVVGSMCTFASVILLGIDTRLLSNDSFVKLCYVKTWTLCLGFTLAFGSMFSKTWRVHSIFTNIRMDRKAIKDSKLLMILAGLLLIDVTVLILWALISPFSLTIVDLPKIVTQDKVIIPQLESCHSDHSAIFQAILYAVKGILMILGCFLAWETRRVNVPALNDSKYIGMSVYNVVVMSVLGLTISVILQERVNEAFALACFFIIFSTTLTLCLVFVPKVVELARNPQGDEPRGYRRGLMKSVVAKGTPANSMHVSKENEKDLLAKAESENQLRRRYLHQKSTQLWDLIDKLREAGDTHFLQQDWCFATAALAAPTVTTNSMEKDPLLDQSKDDHSGFDHDEMSSDWPYIDPDEPSTML